MALGKKNLFRRKWNIKGKGLDLGVELGLGGLCSKSGILRY